MTLTEARNRFLELADQLQRKPDTVVEVSRRGKPILALLSAERYEALLETLEILGDSETLRALKRARREVATRKTVPWKHVRKSLGIER